MASSSEEQRREESQKECVHRTKAIQFFGRTVPIIIQNENGPCPLLAICNVLFLKNQLNLNPDINEVSQEKLLSLVAERLIDSNSNVKDKDAGYVQNQEQNIADAIDLLPRLTTGIDVNIKFHRIDDFEFTPECAIFDLLDIPLYHGWLVDPQDCETAKAIGPKSYNTLTRELVSLQEVEGKNENKSEEDSVDFAAATAATLGVPSPSLSRAKSFDESPRSTSPRVKKEDAEEEAELSKILKISEMGSPAERNCSVAAVRSEENVANSSSHCFQMISTPINTMDMSQQRVNDGEVQSESSVLLGSNIPERSNADINSLEVPTPEKPDIFASVTMEEKCINQPDILSSLNDPAENAVSVVVKDEIQPSLPLEIGSSPKGDNDVQTQQSPASGIPDETNKDNPLKVDLQVQSPSGDGCNEEKYRPSGIENPTVSNVDSESSNGIAHAIDECESFSSSLNGSEPLYEGEECIIDSAVSMAENREPVYEGEVVLAKQADEKTVEACNMTFKNELTPQEGKMITKFLKNSASQLTFHGLFSLQEGLKERELCVFFRNNHFCTMFKFEGNLYLLVTDQGYLNQPNLVWEKLNEVNGDTVFVTSDFKEFKLENQSNGTWDQQNAVSSTADYMASIENAGQDGSNMNSDLQLALALQQQEFEQQPQRPAPTQQTHTTAATPVGPSRMVTGPQRPSARPTPTPPKQDRKSKETCCIM